MTKFADLHVDEFMGSSPEALKGTNEDPAEPKVESLKSESLLKDEKPRPENFFWEDESKQKIFPPVGFTSPLCANSGMAYTASYIAASVDCITNGCTKPV